MIETTAAMFGMSIDDLVKIIAALTAAISTLFSAAATSLIRLRGARKRAFVKIRRVEAVVELLAQKNPNQEMVDQLIMEMRNDQRIDADMKDGYDH